MVKQHLKRIFTPRTWKIKRKDEVFITKPRPGGHPIKFGVSVSTFFKEMLNYCKTTKEVKQILNYKEIQIDCKRKKDHRHMVGLMDVVTTPDESYRIMLSNIGHLSYVKIDKEESGMKPSKIANKTLIKGGKVQINFTDGRNIVLDKNDYKTGDSLLLNLKENKVIKHFKLDVGSYILLTGGSHIGKTGELKSIVDKTITFVTPQGKEMETKIEHAFVIGDNKPQIALE